MKVSEFTFDSSTAHNKIFTRLYEPDGEPKAILQISQKVSWRSIVRCINRFANTWRSAALSLSSTITSAMAAV